MKYTFPLLPILIMSLLGCKQTSKHNTNTREQPKTQNEQTLSNAIAKQGQSLTNFVPNGYFLFDSAIGSPNQNNEQFIAIVAAPNIEKRSDTFSEVNRQLIILKKDNGKLIQIASNNELILCKDCGGVFGDPYAGIEIKNNILKVSNFGGSAWRWGEDYTFRFQNNEWQLIGATYSSFFNAKDCNGEVGLAGRQLEDINFAAAKMQILHTEGDKCEPYEDYIKKIEKKQPIAFNDFPGQASQWPGGKIKDGDGKDGN